MRGHAHARPTSRNRTNSPVKPSYSDGAFAGLNPAIQDALAAAGYETPTPIQEQCIPCLLEGRDILGTAQTGTGKTAAFSLPLLQRLSNNRRGRSRRGTPRALILAPTRELAAQIRESIETYGRFLRISSAVIFGGVNQSHQVRALNRGVDILVATPGRLLDLIEQGYIHLDEVEVLILDEVDRMLDMGFVPDVKRILSLVPKRRQSLFFSATMSRKMEELAQTMVVDPVRVSIAPDKPAVESIDQKVLFVSKGNKNALLVELMKDSRIFKAIIFTQMKHNADKVAKRLTEAGIRSTAIHGNKSQGARTRALRDFKSDHYRVLVATDVAARGLDVDDITHVINYNLPVEAETYVHRIGRTARAGAEGNAISFCSADERAYLRDIENLLGRPVPTDREHRYHCDEAFRSTQPAPKRQSGGNGSNGGNGRGRQDGAKKSPARNRSRRRRRPRN